MLQLFSRLLWDSYPILRLGFLLTPLLRYASPYSPIWELLVIWLIVFTCFITFFPLKFRLPICLGVCCIPVHFPNLLPHTWQRDHHFGDLKMKVFSERFSPGNILIRLFINTHLQFYSLPGSSNSLKEKAQVSQGQCPFKFSMIISCSGVFPTPRCSQLFLNPTLYSVQMTRSGCFPRSTISTLRERVCW